MNIQCTDKVLGMYNNTLVLTLLSFIEILSPKLCTFYLINRYRK